jgi:hypothetical protein
MRKTRDRLENRNTRFHKPDGEKEETWSKHDRLERYETPLNRYNNLLANINNRPKGEVRLTVNSTTVRHKEAQPGWIG